MMKGYVIIFSVLVGFLLAITSVTLAANSAIAPGWIQVNTDGFGDTRNAIQLLEVYDSYLYAGTWSGDGGNHTAQIWRAADGKDWNQVSPAWAVANELVFDAGIKILIVNFHIAGQIWLPL